MFNSPEKLVDLHEQAVQKGKVLLFKLAYYTLPPAGQHQQIIISLQNNFNKGRCQCFHLAGDALEGMDLNYSHSCNIPDGLMGSNYSVTQIGKKDLLLI
jgi:hypothetical protein